MNRRQWLLSASALAFHASGRAGAGVTATTLRGPDTPRRPTRIEQLGRVRIDDYVWLKPVNWKAVWRDPSALDPAIRAYLELENQYCDAVLAPTEPVRERLLAEMARGAASEVDTPPEVDGPWAYITRFGPGAQHASYWRRPAAGGGETLMLDGEARAAGHPFFRIVEPAHGADGALFAWAEDTAGAEKYTIYIKDLNSGEIIRGPGDAFGDFVLSPDSRWLFWTWRDAASRPARIYRRPVRGGEDVLVHEESDPAFLMHVRLSGSGRYGFIRCWNDVTSEVWLIDMAAPEAAPTLVLPRRTGHVYTLEHWRDDFVVLTNAGGATDFRLMRTPRATPGESHWREWVPHEVGRTIIDMRAFAGHFVRVERVEGNPTLVVSAADGVWGTPVAFEEAAYVLSLGPSDYRGRILPLSFESPRAPKAWIDLDLASGRRIVVAEAPLPPPYGLSGFVVRRLHAVAADGARVPITVLHKAGLALDGSAPVMLTGYGAYGISFETGFSMANLVLAERGWVWAAAHVRGGSEKGRAWFEAARGLGKTTSFSDFIACAETLIQQGYGARGRLVAHGFSAGGLLVGAALNLRPDLWAGVIGQAPFVDILSTMSDATHPLVPLTRPVWGDPLASLADYDNIASYSPYDNVAARPYPPVLATTAVADDRVGFWEPARWIARLRARSTSGAPMLLHTEMAGGHVGAAGRFDQLAQVARTYAFAQWVVGRAVRPAQRRGP